MSDDQADWSREEYGNIIEELEREEAVVSTDLLCVPEICATCEHWEPRGDPQDANGYCQIFDKITNEGHGKRCTAWEISSHNASEQRPDQKLR